MRAAWPAACTRSRSCVRVKNCNESNMFEMNNKLYRQMLLQKCKEKDELLLRQMAEGKIKCAKTMNEGYGKKGYLSLQVLSKVRQTFYTRVRMQPFAGNFPGDRRFSKTNHMCKCTKEKEDE